MTKAEKSELFGEKAVFLEGNKTKRMHVYIDKETDEKVRKEVEKLNLSISDFVLYSTLTFHSNDIPHKLDEALEKINCYMRENKVPYKKRNKGAFVMSEIEKYNEEKREADTSRAGQFHLRVTPEAFEEIKRRAASFSMSVSDYVVFTVTHFDIVEISEKIDEINAKLDAIRESQGK